MEVQKLLLRRLVAAFGGELQEGPRDRITLALDVGNAAHALVGDDYGGPRELAALIMEACGELGELGEILREVDTLTGDMHTVAHATVG